MKVVGLSGSSSGSNTIVTMREAERAVGRHFADVDFTMIDLRDYQLEDSDGRDYHEYEGDPLKVATALAEADALLIGFPICQGSFPGTLKNVLDLLPEGGLKNKVVGIIANAGSSRYFLVPEYQLKPVITAMKGQVVGTTAFVEAREIYRTEIIEDATKDRIDRVAVATVRLAEALRQKGEH